MSEAETLRHRLHGLPVRSVEVEVIDGPDKGQRKAVTSETLSVGTAPNNDLVLSDPTVSRYHLELAARGDEITLVDLHSTNGTRVGATRVERGAIAVGTVLSLGKTQLKVLEGRGGTVDLLADNALGPLRGKTSSMRRVMAAAERAGQSDAALLVVGESGTGKELVARAVHEAGKRAARPFVTVDCGVLAPTLIASELFGHERGAFTGAEAQHAGAFERAEGGTLFLDELGELPLELQPTLLGVLERKRFRRLGGKTELQADVRTICATNRDLRAEVNSGKFRLDLYFRVAVLRIELPALRDHRDDVPLLVDHFLAELGSTKQASEVFPAAAMQSLLDHRWPGNVRELKNFVEASLALGELATLERFGAPEGGELFGAALERLREVPYRTARQQVLDEFEARYLGWLLERAKGNVSGAARLAEMDRSHLVDLLKRHKLK